jgi:hypothetical protein
LRLRETRVLYGSVVIADVEGEGYEGGDDIGVWVFGRKDTMNGKRNPLFSVFTANAMAAAASTFPEGALPGNADARLDVCIQEVQRLVSTLDDGAPIPASRSMSAGN